MAVEYIQNGRGIFYVASYPCNAEFAARVMQIATRTNESFWLVPGTIEDES